MSDIQLAVLLAAMAVIGWYLQRGVEQEAGASGILEERPAPKSEGAAEGLRWLLLGHAANLILSIPLLARHPFSIDEGHSMTRWLTEFISPWLRWVGLTQLIYVGPLWKSFQNRGITQAARATLLAASMTLAVSGLGWCALLQSGPGASSALQAASSLLALACCVAIIWLARELRSCLRTKLTGSRFPGPSEHV